MELLLLYDSVVSHDREDPVLQVAVAVLSLFVATSVFAQETPAITLFTNVNVFDGKSQRLFKDTSVLVEGNLIAEIGPNSAREPATVIDGGGRTLMR